MNILSNTGEDVRHSPQQPGGYEWWYFDALSEDGNYSFVIIFYEGNPFSTRYNRALMKGQDPRPSHHPAISISVYEWGRPIYYSFTEFEESDCRFGDSEPSVRMGPHRMTAKEDPQVLRYELQLEEELASGDRLKATIGFKSPKKETTPFAEPDGDRAEHAWNLVQPRAEVQAEFSITAPNKDPREITFRGRGYHDHNGGSEPMRNEFTDWYWGRFHFEYATLVYYVMNRKPNKQYRAWLISNNNEAIIESFNEITLGDRQLTLFGLKPARKISICSGDTGIRIQHGQVLDNGPFYQRYQSDAFLRIPAENILEKQRGISEYLYPDRIYSRAFWPFVDMRIRYKSEKPHWVQRIQSLYRWTW